MINTPFIRILRIPTQISILVSRTCLFIGKHACVLPLKSERKPPQASGLTSERELLRFSCLIACIMQAVYEHQLIFICWDKGKQKEAKYSFLYQNFPYPPSNLAGSILKPVFSRKSCISYLSFLPPLVIFSEPDIIEYINKYKYEVMRPVYIVYAGLFCLRR